MTSPSVNVPETFPTRNIRLLLSQFLTLPIAPEVPPVTFSPSSNVPIPDSTEGSDIVTVGAAVYPTPGFIILRKSTVFNLEETFPE